MCPFVIGFEFDEYSDIVGPGRPTVPDIHVLVDRYFEDKGLLLCIIESVTIGNLDGVGHTHLRMHAVPHKEMLKTLKDYKELVLKVRDANEHGLSGYSQWYEGYDSVYVVGSHEVYSVPANFRPLWANMDEETKVGRGSYVTNHRDSLSENWIKTYLTRYVEHLERYEWFKSLPHYIILVKPLTLHDVRDGKWLPLGNIYYLFGFAECQDLEMLKGFVNKHVHVWLRNYGAQVAKELEQQAKQSVLHPGAVHVPNTAKARTKPVIRGQNITIEDLCKTLFGGSNDDIVKEHVIQDINHPAFSYLSEVLKLTRDIPRNQHVEVLRDIAQSIGGAAAAFRTKPILSGRLEKEYLQDFAKRLSMRRVLQTYLFLCRAPLPFINDIRTGNPNDRGAAGSSVITYLIDHYWIPYPKNDERQLSNRGLANIWQKASLHERKMLLELHKRVLDHDSSLESHTLFPKADILSYSGIEGDQCDEK